MTCAVWTSGPERDRSFLNRSVFYLVVANPLKSAISGICNWSAVVLRLEFFTQVPWGIRQLDAHKECLFLLACYDTDEPSEYLRNTLRLARTSTECFAVKSHQVNICKYWWSKFLWGK